MKKRGLPLPIGPRRDYKSRLNRRRSPVRMMVIPVISVMLGSMATTLPIFTDMALMPPFGLLIFLAWRFLRPEMWPIWAGLPFGLYDDIFSGHAFGSAGLIWSLAMLGLQLLDTRMPWRDYLQDWLIAGIIIIMSLLLGLLFIGLAHHRAEVITLLPQMILSVAIFPLMLRLCSRLDRIRLAT